MKPFKHLIMMQYRSLNSPTYECKYFVTMRLFGAINQVSTIDDSELETLSVKTEDDFVSGCSDFFGVFS